MMAHYRNLRVAAILALVGGCLFFGIALSNSSIVQAQEKADRPVSSLTRTRAATPNIILIVVDALRADHVSAYGYARSTTPHLDSTIALQGVTFRDATVASAWTYPSNAAILTSLYPSSVGAVWQDPHSAIPSEKVMLAEYLHDAGYYTAGFNSALYAGAELGFAQGFDVFQESIGDDVGTRASEVNALATSWLDTAWAPVSGTQPLFLYLYYIDPHTWYDPPAPYDTLYDSTYTGTFTAATYGHGVGVASGIMTPTQRDVEHVIALYDGEITYWDVYLGQMMAHLDGLGLLNNSIVIVTSDHGQMFGEHGKWVHRNSLYEEVLRVPLLVRYTGVISPGLVVSTPVQTLDIVPSILDWIGLPIPTGLHGTSLTALASGEPFTGTRDIFSELGVDALSNPDWFVPHYPLQAIRRGEWKYIHQIGAGGADELYQLEPASLYETLNLIQTEPGIAAELLDALFNRFGPTRSVYLPSIMKGIPH